MDPKLSQFIHNTAHQVFNDKIDDALNQRELYNQVNLSPTPTHSHDGIGSPPIDPANLVNANSYFALQQTTVTDTQIKALHTTPITIVPAIGKGTSALNVNSVTIVEGITAKIFYVGTAFTGLNALEFRYTDASGAKVTADIPNTFINSGANAFAHVAGVTTALTPVVNSPITVSVPVANPAAGNGIIVFVVKYRVVSL